MRNAKNNENHFPGFRFPSPPGGGNFLEIIRYRHYRHYRRHRPRSPCRRTERIHVVLFDGVGDLVGFLDGVRGDGSEILLNIPRATAVGIAELGHDVDEAADVVFFVTHEESFGAKKAIIQSRGPNGGGKGSFSAF